VLSYYKEHRPGVYDTECDACEVVCKVDSAQLHRRIRNALVYDKARDNARGRALTADIPELRLRVGDRLEPGRDIADVGQGFDDAVTPVEVVFWRRSNEVRTRHRNPMLRADLGLDPATAIAADWLHTIFLGVLLRLVHRIFWILISADFGGSGEATAEGRAAVGVAHLSRRLVLYYAEQRRRGTPVGTEVQCLNAKMIGAKDQPKLKFKAAELSDILPFAASELEQNMECVRGSGGLALLAAAEALMRYIAICKEQPRIVPRTVCEDAHAHIMNSSLY